MPKKGSSTYARASYDSQPLVESLTDQLRAVHSEYRTLNWEHLQPVQLTEAQTYGSLRKPLLVVLNLSDTLYLAGKGPVAAAFRFRRYTRNLLELILKNCYLMVWNSESQANTDFVVHHLLGSTKTLLTTVWSEDNYPASARPVKLGTYKPRPKILSEIWRSLAPVEIPSTDNGGGGSAELAPVEPNGHPPADYTRADTLFEHPFQRAYDGQGHEIRWGPHNTVLIDSGEPQQFRHLSNCLLTRRLSQLPSATEDHELLFLTSYLGHLLGHMDRVAQQPDGVKRYLAENPWRAFFKA
ncbi:hypothetical protein H4R33_000135 [Dimargaris cristalligena]|uniref:FCP1 homology domain-containing protein n=1 Tax=Dimargaris cristalligena TaxID=215637 RepID=A0A4Q0A328_9FUNG|nr:hypothetical protein H4R33_000135 [Dimargaris cristalligena]RKP40258.1 hypothetical protein BJ085DRAFT_32304 [Dimargaris cristalligena]|eukprot:RKP40258.1 hypothetical protein BJ085DRAFT_32304 [Dimargaris cristalligena]